jgi:hypothetical protein
MNHYEETCHLQSVVYSLLPVPYVMIVQVVDIWSTHSCYMLLYVPEGVEIVILTRIANEDDHRKFPYAKKTE